MNDNLDAIRRVLAADVESFRRLVERYQRPLLTRIRTLAPPDTDYEGVAQEVFLAAFGSPASFDPKRSAISIWLFTIAGNRCRNELARRRPVVGALLPDVVDLRSPERAASEAEGEGAGRDVFRAGQQPEQFSRQPHDGFVALGDVLGDVQYRYWPAATWTRFGVLTE
jgi:RNA polymerase sigma factor (sigma-70 family)